MSLRSRLKLESQRWLFYGFCGCLGLCLVLASPIRPTFAQASGQASPASLQPAHTLNLQGQQALERGDPQTALDRWIQAETLYRQVAYQPGTIGTQLNQAKALQALGSYRQAKVRLEKLVVVQRDQPDSVLKANSLLTLGSLLRVLGDYPQAQSALEDSLKIAQQLRSLPDIQAAYFHLGNLHWAQQQFQQALTTFERAAAIAGPLQLPAQLRQLKLLQQLHQPTAALMAQVKAQVDDLLIAQLPNQIRLYSTIELAMLLPPTEVQQAAQQLAKVAQQAQHIGDQRAESYAIGQLAALYEQQHRWPEALELTERALNLARVVNMPEILYQWQWQKGRILRQTQQQEGAIAAYQSAVKTLQDLRYDLVVIDSNAQFSFREKVEPVYRELVDLLLQVPASAASSNPAQSLDSAQVTEVSQAHLQQAREVIESLQLAELHNFFREPCLDGEPTAIDAIDPQAAVIYPILLPNRLEVILTLPGQPLRHYTTQLPQKDIEAGIAAMQASLRRTSFEKERLMAAQTLYDWIVAPAAADLAQRQIKTLVFVLDGSLRNVPMAALYTGTQYLVEQYQIAVAPGLQLLSPRKLQSVQALVGGLSDGKDGASPLPGVQEEVSQIRQQITAQVLLNQAFTTTALKTEVQALPFNVIHLATHGQFSSNSQETYIQTWDGRLTIDGLKTLLNPRSLQVGNAIELLVLSACQTALGDDRAALGMAGVAVRSGARSTLATLWQVNDRSTAEFVTKFYQSLVQPQTNKAQAVRDAQLALIHSAAFNHPFYWAPFILVGNWL
ncbi:CHAT domain-containing protein [Alkalinema pantanalense CENA528]|uniref:CHAT domain-containing protein n=1 Tax=Alkalinema pantanalense TaxID=1620705 RepID=UPI003D6E38D0